MKPTLTSFQLDELLAAHPDWHLDQKKLIRNWTFPDFVAAMTFVNHIAALAESAAHHPDIDIRYNRVTLGLISHDADGITQRDASMIARLDNEFPA